MTPQTVPATDSPSSVFEIIFSGGPIGIAIMLLLIALSLAAVYLIVEQILALRRGMVLPDGLGELVRQCVQMGQWAEAQQACRNSPSMLGHVLFRGVCEVEGGWDAIEEALEESLAEHAARMFRRVEYLSVLANLAPMVGLLGTVFGMVLCFREVASTQGNAGAGQLAEGIYQALVTTVAGLMIAIPSLAAFALLRNRVDQFIAEAARIAQHAFAPLKRRSSNAAPPQATGGVPRGSSVGGTVAGGAIPVAASSRATPVPPPAPPPAPLVPPPAPLSGPPPAPPGRGTS